MSLLHRTFFSLLVIRYALAPDLTAVAGREAPDSPQGESRPDGFGLVTSATIRSHLAALADPAYPHPAVSLYFPGCLSLAAPFLLFRLKRHGFSACRATSAPEGIYLTARR